MSSYYGHVPPPPPPQPDPLIAVDFNGWWKNTIAAIKRSGLRVAIVMSIWTVAFVVATELFNRYALDRLGFSERLPDTASMSPSEAASILSNLVVDAFAFAAASLVLSLVLMYLTFAGMAAATRIVITDAANTPISMGAALAYGARRGVVLWGWQFLVTVCVMAGVCFCLLPGVYLLFAFSLVIPVVVCEGGAAMARSMRLIHRAFGETLLRVSVLVLFSAPVIGAMFGLYSLIPDSYDSMTLAETFGTPAGIALTVLSVLIAVVGQVLVATIMAPGLLVTYAESRAGEGSLQSTHQLLGDAPA